MAQLYSVTLQKYSSPFYCSGKSTQKAACNSHIAEAGDLQKGKTLE
jgi:hypothetical protein